MAPLKNTRWETFCLAILAGKSQTDAYLAAGYKAAASARQNASELMTKPDIQARIAELKEAAAQGAVMAANEVLVEMTKIGRLSIDHPGLPTKRAALVDLGKHHGLFEDKLKVEVTGIAERIARARERLEHGKERPHRDPAGSKSKGKASRKGKRARAR